MERRFHTRQTQLRNRYLNTEMFSDTMFSSTKLAAGKTCAHLFVTWEGFPCGETMKSKSEAGEALEKVYRDIGIPRLLVTDGAKEE